MEESEKENKQEVNVDNLYNYKIFTMTVSCIYSGCTFNIINIGKFLDIDDSILGIKYNYGDRSVLKGIYTTSKYKKSRVKNIKKVNTVLFYNQISLVVKTDNNIVNAKLFSNGSLHLTGVKNSNQPKMIMKILYEKLLKLKDKRKVILLSRNSNGVLLDNNNLIYSNNDNKYIIGFNNEFKYIINKKTYTIDFYTGCFITEKIEAKRTRSLINLDGDYIGYTKIELLKNKLKLYKKNSNIYFDYKNETNEIRPYYFIYYDGDGHSSIIGKVVYYINEPIQTVNSNNTDTVIEYNYNCNPFKIENVIENAIENAENKIENVIENAIENAENKIENVIENAIIDINCINVYFNLNIQLNRNRLFEKLLDDKYICDLKSEKYSGLKFVYKKNMNDNTGKLGICPGICYCDMKCTCTNITFSIFQSGNVNVFGFKSEQDINKILSEFKKIIDKYVFIIKKRIF